MTHSFVHLDTQLLDPVRGKIDQSYAQGFEIQSKTKHLALKFCISGTENYITDKHVHNVSANQCLILSPDETFDFYCSSDEVTKGMCIDIGKHFFNPTNFDDEFERLNLNLDPIYGTKLGTFSSHSTEKKIIHLFQSIYGHTDRTSYHDDWLLEIAGLLLELNSSFNKQKKGLNQHKKSTQETLFNRLRKAQEVIHDGYSEKLTLAQIALEVNLSKFHCQRYFKKFFGASPQQYLENFRLEKAYEIYLTTHCSISELSDWVGFSDPRYFSKRFKKKYGILPTEL